MSRRKVDPETGEPALTWRENKMIDGFVSNGGNASQAALDARPELARYVHQLRQRLAASVETDSRGTDPRQPYSSG